MKKIKLMLGILVMLIICVSSSVNINAATLGYEEKSILESKELVSGVNYKRVDATTTNDSGTVKAQKVSVVEVEKGSAEVVSWSRYNASGIIGSTVTNIAKDYEATHPGYKVIAGINADYFNMSNFAPINAIVQDGDVIKSSNHVKYPSIAFNNDGSDLIKVKEADDGMRLNRWFLKYYPGLSLGRFQKLVRTKQIKVNSAKAEANTRLEAGFEVRVPPLDNEKKEQVYVGVSQSDTKFIESIVIYKDEKIIVLNKPSGLAVQGGTNTERHVDGMLEALKFEKDEKPKLVHRIDKDTSGVLVLARDRKTADMLTKAFREHNLKKTYLALARGVISKMAGEIKAPLDKIDGRVQVIEGGKHSVTEYEILDTVGDRFSLVKASPLTGRTHQIRVQFASRKMSLLGDDKYGNHDECDIALFSYKLAFNHPVLKDKRVEVSALPSNKYPWNLFDLKNI